MWHVHRKIRDADPANWPAKTIYKYKEGNSTTTLRGHIEREHLDEFLKLIKEKGWKVRLRSQGKLISQASVSSTSVQPDRFDQETFHNHLVKFIVTNDQVGNRGLSSDLGDYADIFLFLRQSILLNALNFGNFFFSYDLI